MNGIASENIVGLNTNNPATGRVTFQQGAGAAIITGTTFVGDNVWRNVVLTVSPGTGTRLYVDGVLQGSAAAITNASHANWPLSLGTVARIIPTAGYGLTYYSENTVGETETRSLPYFKIALEGPRPYRIWDLSGDGPFTKLKHLVEPRVMYVYAPDVNQETNQARHRANALRFPLS